MGIASLNVAEDVVTASAGFGDDPFVIYALIVVDETGNLLIASGMAKIISEDAIMPGSKKQFP